MSLPGRILLLIFAILYGWQAIEDYRRGKRWKLTASAAILLAAAVIYFSISEYLGL